ncbi:hypothetical protein [Mesorhizobium sp. M0968]|uniref:hypothetical protein n=1 Tax=Mesorhizobium sp. M0968 TaxID=2957037 RepID=UPI003334D5E3
MKLTFLPVFVLHPTFCKRLSVWAYRVVALTAMAQQYLNALVSRARGVKSGNEVLTRFTASRLGPPPPFMEGSDSVKQRTVQIDAFTNHRRPFSQHHKQMMDTVHSGVAPFQVLL